MLEGLPGKSPTTTDQEDGVHTPSKDSVRLVVQSVIVLLLGWVGYSLTQLQKDTAVIQAQLLDLRVTMSNVPNMQRDMAVNRVDINQLQKDVKDVKDDVKDLKLHEYQ